MQAPSGISAFWAEATVGSLRIPIAENVKG
jgi:hypothetical protein